MENPAPPPRRRRKLRWLLLAAVVPLLVGLLLTALLPSYLSTPSMRAWLLRQANQALAPDGSLDVARFHFSWFGPTRLDGFTLRNGQSKIVVRSPSALWDRTLAQILFERPDYGTLDLGPARLDIERRADGTIDLYEALGPLKQPNPHANLNVRVRGGSLRLASPGLDRPFEVESIDVVLNRPPAPRPIAWDITLAGRDREHGPTLQLDGTLDRWKAPDIASADLTLAIQGDDWPVDYEVPGLRTLARLDGLVKVTKKAGEWSAMGDAAFLDLAATGSTLGGRAVRLPRVHGRWDVAQSQGAWAIRALDVKTPVGELRAVSTPGPRRSTRLTGQLDLAALEELSPGLLAGSLAIQQGHARLEVQARTGAPQVASSASAPIVRLVSYQAPPPAPQPPSDPAPPAPADLPATPGPATRAAQPPADSPPVAPPATPAALEDLDLEAQITLPDLQLAGEGGVLEVPPLTLLVRGGYEGRDASRIRLDQLLVTGPQGVVDAHGTLSDLGGARLAQLEGTITPAWDDLQRRLEAALEPGATLSGEPIAFRLEGPLAGNAEGAALFDRLIVTARWDIHSADLFGIQVGPTTLAVHGNHGQVAFEPIRTTINGGTAEIRPTLQQREDGTWLAGLEPGSAIRDAAINEDVSHRVLAYVVPLLDDATRVTGAVSAEIARAEFPLSGELDLQRNTIVEGQIVFADVEFGPGPLARSLVDIAAPAAEPRLRLDQPVVLDIHDGRVYQHGLSASLGTVARFTMEGSVGFDRTLDLAVSVPLQAERFQNVPVFNRISSAIRPTIPISGTLSEPRVDGQALRQSMGRMGLDIANEAAVGGIGALFDLLNRPPLTPEQQAQRDAEIAARKAEQERKRQERRDREAQKKLERQMRRNRNG